ncbi:MAG: sigma-70 family RNA polymerase sigma factor, partial [Elusimicrobia bacterium]|nr:sigma-70 family RNA polymerase sigma factor [Elusimicrobiota bacterium]
MLDMLQAYFLELKNVKPATEEEIGKLWARIKKQDKKAIKRMTEINYCLVIPIAKKFIRRGVDLMDLIADGNLGLMKAVEKFDPEKNIKFSTYATYWIEQYIRKSIEDNSKTVRIPSYMYEIISKWKKARNMLMAKLNKEPTVEQIAKELDISVDKAEEINSTLFSFD